MFPYELRNVLQIELLKVIVCNRNIKMIMVILLRINKDALVDVHVG